MPPLPTLQLKPREDRRLRQGHLWVYSNEIDNTATPLNQLAPGSLAEIRSHQGQRLGLATVNPHSLICARILTRQQREPDLAFFTERFQQARTLRERFYPGGYYRLVYGDSDGLPGLVVDRFGDYLVVQPNTAGMESLLPLIVDSLSRVFEPRGIWLDGTASVRQMEQLPAISEPLKGHFPETVSLEENGCQFQVSIQQGQKTGWFYDHRDNRLRLNQWCRNARVLDVFSYVGGWGIQAACQGAASATLVDSSQPALDLARLNAASNQVHDKIQTLQGDAFAVLKSLVEDKQQFDIVVLDPPAFIKKRKDQATGSKAYRRLHELGLRLLADQGILVAASCSLHYSRDHLVNSVRGALRHVDRHGRLLAFAGAGADHPVHPAIPETDYLKAGFFHISAPQ